MWRGLWRQNSLGLIKKLIIAGNTLQCLALKSGNTKHSSIWPNKYWQFVYQGTQSNKWYQNYQLYSGLKKAEIIVIYMTGTLQDNIKDKRPAFTNHPVLEAL